MSQTIQVEISDEAYRCLARLAEREGKTPAELSAEIVNLNVAHLLNDPLDEFIGKINTGMPGWTDRHDELLGEQLARELKGKTE